MANAWISWIRTRKLMCMPFKQKASANTVVKENWRNLKLVIKPDYLQKLTK